METLNKVKETGTKELVHFYWDAIKLLNNYHSHDFYITKTLEQFFGRVVIRLSMQLPELELMLLGASKLYGPKDAEALKEIMIREKVISLNDLHIDYEIKSKKDFDIDQYKYGYAERSCEYEVGAIESIIKYIIKNKKINIVYKDETNP
jgi:hypothetical protein